MRTIDTLGSRASSHKPVWISLIALLFSMQLTAQNLLSVSPDSAMQGNQVTIMVVGTQTNFTAINNTFFISLRQGTARVNCDSFSVQTDSLLFAYFSLPYNLSGWCNINVGNFMDGNMVLSNSFFIVTSPTAPNLISIEPDSAYQGTSVVTTIASVNTNYASGTINLIRLEMGFNRITADSFTIINDSSIIAYFSFPVNSASGLYNLRIGHSSDGTLFLNACFEVLVSPFKPIIMAISPDNAFQGESVAVSVIGNNTNFQTGINNYIRLQRGPNMLNADSAFIINDTSMIVYFTISYQMTPNLYDFRIDNTIDGLLNLTQSFLIKKSLTTPQIIAIYPSEGDQNQYVKVTVNGTNSHFLTGVTTQVLLRMGANLIVYADSFDIDNDSLLDAHFNIPLTAQTGLYDFRVVNNVDGTLQLGQSFRINATTIFPQITSVNPGKLKQKKSYMLSIDCQYTTLNTPTPPIIRLVFNVNNSISMDSIQVVNDTFVYAYCTVPETAPVGFYDVEIIPYGAAVITGNDLVEVLVSEWAPQLSLVDPNKAHQGDSLTVSVYGKNTNFTGGTGLSVRLRQGNRIISPQSLLIVNDSLIEASFVIFASTRTGFYTVEVNGTIHGDLLMPNGFEILVPANAPQIEYIMPAKGVKGESLAVLIKGKNTHFIGSTNPRVFFQNVQGNFLADSVGLINDTIAMAYITIPATVPVGFYDVRMIGITDGNLSFATGFEVIGRPIVTNIISLTPDSAYQGDTVQLTIYCTGTEFMKAKLLQVFMSNPLEADLMGTEVTPIDDTTLTVVFTFNKYAWIGLWDVTILSDISGEITETEFFNVLKSTNGIDMQDLVLNAKVYPNPVSSFLNLELETEQDYFIQVFDLNGKLMLEKRNLKQIDVTELPAASYMLRVSAGNKQFTSLFIKE